MPLMTWSDKLSVGIDSIDNEHKKLLALLNELFDGVQAGHGKEVLGKVLDNLISYTKVHFGREETFMQKHAYPEFAAHKKEHDELARQVLEVQAKYKAGSSMSLNMEVLNFLKNWLTKHIQGSDKKYGPHLSAKGVK